MSVDSVRRFILGSAGLALAIGAVSLAIAGENRWSAVVVAVGVGWLFQVVMLWFVGVKLFPGRPLQVFALGFMGRMALVGGAALWGVERIGVDPATALLTLVAVLFSTTVLEPLLLRADTLSVS